MALLATDRLDHRLDADGDLYIGPNGREWISGIEGVTQLATIQLKLFLAEWFADLEKGIEWFDVLGQKFTTDVEKKLRARITQRMRAVPAVVEVFGLAFALDGETRGLGVTLGLRTEFGDTPPDAIAASIGGR